MFFTVTVRLLMILLVKGPDKRDSYGGGEVKGIVGNKRVLTFVSVSA